MMRILYGHPASGSARRARLTLSLLGLPFEERTISLQTGEQRGEEFLRINPLGQVPVLVDDDRTIRDSHAIMIYLAGRYDLEGRWWPLQQPDQALVAQWLFLDANDLHNGVGMARNHFTFGIPLDGEAAKRRGERAIDVIDRRLAEGDWLELGRPTLVDIACHSLVALASQARISLDERPRVQAWLDRIAALQP